MATDRFDHAVADALGVNRTDMRCMDMLEREGPLPAGRLAEAAGLTSGAMTTALDRLERAGFVRRVRDREDRRRVLVELTPEAGRVTTEFYSEHAAMSERSTSATTHASCSCCSTSCGRDASSTSAGPRSSRPPTRAAEVRVRRPEERRGSPASRPGPGRETGARPHSPAALNRGSATPWRCCWRAGRFRRSDRTPRASAS